MKKCPKCNVLKDDSLFNKSKAAKDGLSGYCKQCNVEKYYEYKSKNPEAVKKRANEYYIKNKDRIRHLAYQRDFGITLEDYNTQLEAQKHKCAICGSKDENKELAVDHCHATGKVRGLLCWRCNGTLGKFEDNVELLQSAINYLNNPPYEDKDE